ncbi:hypothetical protein ABPG75_007495 [Micractinium tetrahymenae]
MAEESSEEADRCRYCLQPADDEEGGAFILPCACRNPVHQRCLRQWLYHRTRGDAQRCEVCQEEWRGAVTVDIQEVVQRLGAAQQGVPQEAVEGAVRALRSVYNGALIQVMLEAEGARVAAGELEGELQETTERADAAVNNANRLAARVNVLAATNQRLQGENSTLRQQCERQQRQLQRQLWLWVPLAAAGGFALGILARSLMGADSSGGRKQEQQWQEEQEQQRRRQQQQGKKRA